METMTESRTIEQIVTDIRNGKPFKYDSPLDPKKIWTIGKNGRAFVISHNKSDRKKVVSEKDVNQIIHNCLNWEQR